MIHLDDAISVTSFALSYVALCRLNVSHAAKTRLSFQIRYLLIFVGAFCSALSQWLFPQSPNTGYLILLACLVAGQIATARDWRHGPPDYTLRGR